MFAREHVLLGLCQSFWLPQRLKAQPKAIGKGAKLEASPFRSSPYLSSAGLVHRVSCLSCGLSRSLNLSRVAASSASPQLQLINTVLTCWTAACGRPRRQHRYRKRAVSSRPPAAVASTGNGPLRWMRCDSGRLTAYGVHASLSLHRVV